MKMNRIASLFLFLLSTTLLISCGNADDDVSLNLNTGGDLGLGKPVDNCLDFGENELLLSIQDQFTTLPGKVSIFFRVSDEFGNPVAGLNASQFTVYEQGRNDDCFNTISASESQARISPNSQIFRNHTLLVLDLSNSVLSSSLPELKSASTSFINNVMPEMANESFQMAVYWFDGEDVLHELHPLTSNRSLLIDAIDSITTDISQDPSTDLYGAVLKSTDIAEDLLDDAAQSQIIGAASVVLFTDGTDQASRYSESSALEAVEEADSNISFFTIGLGAEIDSDVLEEIGKTFSVFAGNKEELEVTFNQLSQKVSERANSFYLFEYCSPKRDGSGENNLVIRVLNNGLSGAVQTKFDATGFTAGCE
ncbi:VWFA-related domain-containing protein [Robiginitalea myxolifaciens]|uniref:VWFA-related domain-containing protein n=1 Tax=Robiginitalea myxolifaciens TaxID=400055 RepID=A0A1I6GY20_9FLAO|nr:VWA domain-containing protein [Robiginitalea myxolifaciens]SFR46989.1 VWFA-related domain-containing protein [Robiginitalea myxolifaciens]